MKEKAMELLRDAIDYNYSVKYDKAMNYQERQIAHSEMVAVYDTLRDLGLVSREEYRALRNEIRQDVRKEMEA